MGDISTFPEPKFIADFSPQNTLGLSPAQFKALQVISQQVAQQAVDNANPIGQVDLVDDTTIEIDASLGSDFFVTLGGNRTMDAPSNNSNLKTIRIWITQDGTGSRTITWNGIFRFSTGLPSPTLTTTANFTDLVEFIYNPTYSTWDCIRIVKGFDSTPL
jgi:hypothetical protein